MDTSFAHLIKLVYNGVRRDRIEAEIEENSESEEVRIAAYDLLEELFIDLELAKQARMKVRENFVVATSVCLICFGISAYTLFRYGYGFILVYAAMFISGWYAARFLVQIQKPLETFSPRLNKETYRFIKRRL
jgi:hypothetical protein